MKEKELEIENMIEKEKETEVIDNCKSLFITFEGPDGAGKSTQIQKVKDFLEKSNIKYYYTREPGGTKLGEKLRNIILDPNNKDMSYISEMLLYAACRANLVEKEIIPRLNSGEVVICDRFIDSSYAYQGYGRNLGEKVWEVNRIATFGLEPDITYLILIDAKDGIDRIEKNMRPKDRLEQESMEFHELVHKGYSQLYKKYPNRIKLIDGKQEVDKISMEILRCLKKKLSERGIKFE